MRHLRSGLAIKAAANITKNIKFTQQTCFSFSGKTEKKTISALKSETIMDLRHECVFMLVCLLHQDSRISEALVSPLRYPFISPEYHVSRADNWTWAPFFYFFLHKIQRKVVFHFSDGTKHCSKCTKHFYINIKGKYFFRWWCVRPSVSTTS